MKLLILSGHVGAGKSTISMLYAKQKPKCVRIETDDLRQMVISPHKAPWEGEEGLQQLRLGVRNACLLAKQFIEAGYDVVIADFVTDETQPIYKDLLSKYSPHIVRLSPNYEIAKARFKTRGANITEEQFKMLYDIQAKFINYDREIDNSSLSAQQVTDQLLKL
jgi:dephospho-CoA kinase